MFALSVPGKPLVTPLGPLFFTENPPSGAHVQVCVEPDLAVESHVGQTQPEVDAGIFDDLVPALDFQVAVVDEVVPQADVQRRMVQLLETAVALLQNPVGLAKEFVIVLQSRS